MAQQFEPPNSPLPSVPQPLAPSYSLPSIGGGYDNNVQHGNALPDIPQLPPPSYTGLPSAAAVYYHPPCGNDQPHSMPQGDANDDLQRGLYNQPAAMNYQPQQPLKLERMPDPWGLQADDASDAASGKGERSILRCGCCMILCVFCCDICVTVL
jgi:hypothetical protein